MVKVKGSKEFTWNYSVFWKLLPLVRRPESQAVSVEAEGKNHVAQRDSLLSWVKGCTIYQRCFTLPSTSIRQKIGALSALSLGIAILGTTAGLGIGEHYQRKALAQLNYAQQQRYLLNDLKTAVFQAKSHSSRFAFVLGDSVWLRYENDRFNQSIQQAKQVVAATERFVNEPHRRTTADNEKLQNLLKTAAITVDAYGIVTESFLREINPWNLKPDEILPAQQHLLRNNSGEIEIALDSLCQQLNQLSETAALQEQQAAFTLERAS